MGPAGDAADEEEDQRRLTECPSTCYNADCEYWVETDGDTCEILESQYGCDCSGCDCPGEACPSTCYDYDCEYWVEKDGDTCADLESTYGCDCSGCSNAWE